MALDAGIILAGRPTQQYDPMGSTQNALALAGGMEQFRAARESRARDAALRASTVMGPDGDIDLDATMRNLAANGAPADYLAELHNKTTNDRAVASKAQRDAQKSALDLGEHKLGIARQAIFALGPQATPEQVAQTVGDLHARIGGLDQMPLPRTQEDVVPFLRQTTRALMGAKETLANARADFDSQSRARAAVGPAGKASQDLETYDQYGGFTVAGNPSEYGEDYSTPAPVNALAAAPQSGLPPGNALSPMSPAAPAGQAPTNALVAPPATTIARRPGLQASFDLTARGEPKPFYYDALGNVQENPEVMKYGLSKAKAGAAVTNTPFEKKYSQNMADRVDKYADEAKNAWQISNQVGLITEVLKDFEGGPSAAVIQKATRYFPFAKDSTTAADFAASIAARLGPAMRVASSGSTSDYEAAQALASLPSLATYAEGRQLLDRMFRNLARRAAYGADLRLKMVRDDDTNDMEQRAEQMMEAKFGGSLLSKEDLAILQADKTPRKAGKHNVQPAPRGVTPPKDMDWKDWSKQ